MITQFDNIIPDGVLFSIKQIDDLQIIKSDMLKKLIYNKQIEVVKLGKKNFVSRVALISYLEANTIPASS